jgi:hypothetical protein
MKAYKNLKIAQKLIVGFLIMAIIATIIGVVGVVGSLGIMRADDRLYREDHAGDAVRGEYRGLFMQIRYNCLKLNQHNPELKARESIGAEIFAITIRWTSIWSSATRPLRILKSRLC